MSHMSLDLVKVIQKEQLKRARRARSGSAARQRRRDTREHFSVRGALGIRTNTEPACVACPVPAG